MIMKLNIQYMQQIIAYVKKKIFNRKMTVKPVYNDHPRDLKIVNIVDRWLLLSGTLML